MLIRDAYEGYLQTNGGTRLEWVPIEKAESLSREAADRLLLHPFCAAAECVDALVPKSVAPPPAPKAPAPKSPVPRGHYDLDYIQRAARTLRAQQEASMLAAMQQQQMEYAPASTATQALDLQTQYRYQMARASGVSQSEAERREREEARLPNEVHRLLLAVREDLGPSFQVRVDYAVERLSYIFQVRRGSQGWRYEVADVLGVDHVQDIARSFCGSIRREVRL